MDKTRQVRKPLLKWGKECDTRDFFWRREKLNLFQYVMVELLLQKTKAENAERTIRTFVSKYNSAESLLADDRGKILTAIKSLGLQNQRLKAIFKISNAFIEGKQANLGNLKGVGHYIANSVCCFYFNKRVPIIDINTSRVISRVFGIENKTDLRRNFELFAKAAQLLPARNYKRFNWTLLDFGALVCKAKPQCNVCPISKHCDYFKTSQLKV